MKFEEHCAESIDLFGEAFPEVHRWPDDFAGKPGIGMRHRRYRHYLAGIEEIKILFGEKAAIAGRQHIISDLGEEGWKEGRDSFPGDEAHYVKMGFY